MSLFGSSSDERFSAIISKPRNTLFDDEPIKSAPASKSSLFADDDDAAASSHWEMPTPKKSSRRKLIQSLLPASAVPDRYTDIFDHISKDASSVGGTISVIGIKKVLTDSMLSSQVEQDLILQAIYQGAQISELSRNEFNVLLALIGLAQEHEDITLDSVDERRRNLPVPRLQSLSKVISSPQSAGVEELVAKSPQRPVTPPVATPTSKSSVMKKDLLDSPDADPWRSPAMHQSHSYESPKLNGTHKKLNNGTSHPARTTSNFSTTSTAGSNGFSTQERPSGPTAWGSYDGSTEASYGVLHNQAVGGGDGGFRGDGSTNSPALETPTQSRSGGRRAIAGGVEETVTITLLPEKEGVFMFQHHNYHVSSPRRGSKVVRRYSDFVWLLDCLHKRFPFRQLPLLPPKRVGVNGNHLAADSTFIEKRRRGLARFTNALVRHPVLSQEQLVIMFLTVPTELTVWRKQATISVNEEFTGKALPPGLEDSLPPTLNDLFERTRSGIRRSAEIYINLCNLLDRLAKRNEGLAADQSRIAHSLQSLSDVSADSYATDTNDVPLLNEGLNATAKHLSTSQTLLEDEAKAWDQGVLEDLKRQRDSLVSMRDLFERRDRYDKDNIPYLERRIQRNENKLIEIRSKPEGLVKPGEIEKTTDAIIKDKESIVSQHARGVFVKECIRDELIYFQQSQYHITRWNQDWAQERVKYSELQAENWKQLHEELDGIQIGS